jgi:hypothetical protein
MKKITAAMENRIMQDTYESTKKHGLKRFVRYAYPHSPAAKYFGQHSGGYYIGMVNSKGVQYVFPQKLVDNIDHAWEMVHEHYLFHYLQTDLYSSSTRVPG